MHNAAIAQDFKNDDKAAVLFQLQSTNDTNLAWKRRLWRELNVFDRENAALLNIDANSFATILLSGIKSGTIKAYSSDDISLSTPLTVGAIDTLTQCDAGNLSLLARTYLNSVSKHSGDTTIKDTAFISSCTYPQQVEFYHIKEKWTLDRRGGQMLVQIDAIAQVSYVNGKKKPIFWFHYTDIRDYISRFRVYNIRNDKDSYSWDVFFEKRLFGSKVIRVSDPFLEEFHTYKISEKVEK